MCTKSRRSRRRDRRSLQNGTTGAQLGEVEFGKRGQSNKENSKYSPEFMNLVDRQNWKTISKVSVTKNDAGVLSILAYNS